MVNGTALKEKRSRIILDPAVMGNRLSISQDSQRAPVKGPIFNARCQRFREPHSQTHGSVYKQSKGMPKLTPFL